MAFSDTAAAFVVVFVWTVLAAVWGTILVVFGGLVLTNHNTAATGAGHNCRIVSRLSIWSGCVIW